MSTPNTGRQKEARRTSAPNVAHLSLKIVQAALVSFAVAWPVPIVLAQETRALTPRAPISLGSQVDVRTLPAGPFAAPPGQAVVEQKKPFLVPDVEELRRLKGRLQLRGVLSQAPNFVGDSAGPSGPSVTAPASSRQFEGLSQVDNTSTLGFGALPPDTNLAVGPTEIFQMVNVVGRITDKSGSPGSASTFSLDSFFGVEALFEGSDPRIIYDADSGRWFGSYLEFSTLFDASALILAVSTTSAPTLFCKYAIPGPTNVLQDFPILGVSRDKVVVSYNGFRFPALTSYAGAGYYVIDKAGLVGCAPSVAATEATPNPGRATIFPVQSLSGTNDLYMAMHTPSSGSLILLTVGGVPGATVVT